MDIENSLLISTEFGILKLAVCAILENHPNKEAIRKELEKNINLMIEQLLKDFGSFAQVNLDNVLKNIDEWKQGLLFGMSEERARVA